MYIVIDVQGMRGRNNQFIPKEVAVVSVKTEDSGHWVVLPPYADDNLPVFVKSQNIWLCDHIHGIAWSKGDTSLQALETNLKRIAGQATRIFTRGSEKSSYLTQLTGYFIINLEDDEEAPSLRHLPRSDVRCIYHCAANHRQAYNCALNNAIRIKAWLSQNEQIASLWEYRTTTSWSIGMSETKTEEEKEPSNHEQSSGLTVSQEHKGAFYRRLPGRSYPEGVDETDGVRS